MDRDQSKLSVGTVGDTGISTHQQGRKLLTDMWKDGMPRQGQLQRWTEHSTLIFKNLKSVEISKNIFNII